MIRHNFETFSGHLKLSKQIFACCKFKTSESPWLCPGRPVDQVQDDDSDLLEIPRSVLKVKQFPYEAVECAQNVLKNIVELEV